MTGNESFFYSGLLESLTTGIGPGLREKILREVHLALHPEEGSVDRPVSDLFKPVGENSTFLSECPFPLILTDKTGQIVSCSENASKTFNLDEESVRIGRVHQFWDPSFWNIPEGILRNISRDPATEQLTEKLITQAQNGTMVQTRVDIFPVDGKSEADHLLFVFYLPPGETEEPLDGPLDPIARRFDHKETRYPWSSEPVEEGNETSPGPREWANGAMDETREELNGSIELPLFERFPSVTAVHTRLDGENFLQNMIELKASDLHLKSGFPPIFRMKDLRLHVADNMKPLQGKEISSFIRILLGKELFEELSQGREIDFAYSLDNGERFRMDAFLSMGSPSLSVRHIKSAIPTPSQLGIPWALRKLVMSTTGLIIVTGPTGSGKSTTLASLIEEINLHRNVHIITLEDPIEYVFHSKKALVNQREIGKDSKTFAQALNKVLRQDPDVIMIGEMRDLETISLAVTAAETGHLVMATLHTRDASSSIERIVDVFPSGQQEQIKAELSNTLLGICCQKLLPKSGGGRVLATEMLVGTNAVRNRIRTGGARHLRNIILTTQSDGMYSFEQNLAQLVKEKLISYETALSNATDVKDLNRFLEVV
ncbi:MAG: Twitching motility protein [Synergistales bacterium 58_81]|nr:MAG: Twitching motility protein [Synergistales bacterium 58_81]